MKERPILFSAPMVRAILDGSKTQTRRIMKPQPTLEGTWVHAAIRGGTASYGSEQGFRESHPVWCPHGWEGDRLWVRETWQYADWTDDGYPFIRFEADSAMHLCERIPEQWDEQLENTWAWLSSDDNYKIDGRAADRRWRPSIHMPRWASRIDLEITGVRVERLQDISETDAKAEGAEPVHFDHGCVADRGLIDMPLMETENPYRNGYALLWDEINGPGSWEANPWVWVIEFKRIKP